MVIAGGAAVTTPLGDEVAGFNGAGDGDRRRDRKTMFPWVETAKLQRSRRW